MLLLLMLMLMLLAGDCWTDTKARRISGWFDAPSARRQIDCHWPARKTAIQTSFTWERLFKNKVGIFAIVFMIWLGLMLVYVPGVNSVFYMARPDPKHSVVSLWILPLIIIYEEIRKYLIRRNANGFFAQCAKW